jgi:hypothetical protein
MGRRRRGLQHMIATKDQLLEQCKPPNISWRRYMEHCELAVNVPDLHSDEYSTDDEQLANEERSNKKRPERITRSNSVIKIREKKWRSTRVCKVY